MDTDGFSDSSDAEVRDGEINLTGISGRNQENAYFPFPSETFFLLYSYAHNISSPKVLVHYTVYHFSRKLDCVLRWSGCCNMFTEQRLNNTVINIVQGCLK
jgi:hypothetical protein